MSYYQNRHSIFQCLGLAEPENYLDVKGTRFILYENGDESLELIFWEDWLLYDYEDWYTGFHIEYTVGSTTYDYQFLIEGTQ